MVRQVAFWRVIACFLAIFYSLNISVAQETTSIPENKQVMVLSLPECINHAMENSPLLLEAQQDIEVSRAKLSEARSGYLPRIHARTSYNYFNTNNVIKTRFPDDIVNTLSENAVISSLRDIAMVSGRNPISGSAISELDVLSAIAASEGSTPTATFDRMNRMAIEHIRETGQDILWTPLMGNQLLRNEVTFRQPVFLWGRVYNLNKQAKEGIGASRSSAQKIENELLFRVNKHYQQVLLAKDGFELATETEIRFKTLRDIIEALYNAGAENVLKLDLLEVEAYLGLVRAKLAETEKSMALSKAALKQVIGLDDDVRLDVQEETQTIEYIDAGLEEAIHQAFLNRPEFDELNHGIDAKRFDIKATRAENRPKIIVDSAFEHNLDNKNYLEPDPFDFRLSVIADIPLFDGLETRSKVNQKKHELEKLKQKQRQLEQGIVLEVTDAILSLEEAKKKVEATQQAVDSAVENRVLSRQSFELEIIDSKKVIEAQLLEAKVKTEYLISIYNYNVAKAKLDKVMGTNDSVGVNFFIDEIQPYGNIKPDQGEQLLFEKPESIL
jgi:outer membrane protein TolC